MHMPTFENPTGGSGSGSLAKVVYTATGLEGTDFVVPIGSTLADNAYAVLWAPSGVTNIPVPDFPSAPGDRTTTQFRVKTADVLTAGDKLTFVLF